MPTPDSINENVLQFWSMGTATAASTATFDKATVTRTCTGAVQFLGDITTNGSIPTGTVFARLPVGFRPGTTIKLPCVVENTSGSYNNRVLIIEPTGNMYINAIANGIVRTRGLMFSIVDSIY